MTYNEKQFVRKPNSGALFKNLKKENFQHSDYTGDLDVDGTQFWVSGWIREAKNGTRFLSLSLKLKGAATPTKDVPFNDSVDL